MAYDYTLPGMASPKKYDPYANVALGYADSTTDLGYNPNDLRRAGQQGWSQAGGAAAIGAAGSLAQLGLTFVETATDKATKERLAELQKHKGLTDAERQQFRDTALNPALAVAGENRLRTEGQLAGMGGVDLRTQNAVRAVGERETQRSLLAAGVAEGQADLQKKAADTAEEHSLLQFQANKATQRIEMIGQTLSELAKQAGPVLAAQPTTGQVTDQQLLAMQAETRPDGSLTYPGLQGKNLDQIRALYKQAYIGLGPGRKDAADIFAGVAPSAP